MTDHRQAKLCADLLAALAEPNRIRIIECLRTGSKNVTELARLLGVEIVNVSHHLGVLRTGGLVVDEKNGRFVIYSLNPKYFNNESNKSTVMDLGWCRVEIPHN
jgi:ArsR family transcriptional regulator, nickel/cobalt-responsive transcriptional repressor